ncbi:right-handed parallel beta-helix repeat-containing protein [Methylobacillus sp. MM3]|uniref:right-handed parallel beta-helix repeat-containing protein n=1 Tax=Methylobacillus sp. MM3 TaxID=1848039 RepID=UPI0010421BB8|nr:right-handed parallel beta-helix repeat-containing protein [Methylobacillus sp. MM3]
MNQNLARMRFLVCGSLLLAISGFFNAADAATLQVGVGKKYLSPSIAAKYTRDGDIVEIDAGVYPKDVALWKHNNLTLRGVGGMAHMQADGASVAGKGIWLIKGNNITIENIEFSGARVRDRNGSGVRAEGTGLTIRNCYFHDNQNGILTGSNKNSDIVVENSEFANNGAGDGKTHNMYIGAVRSFTLKYSYSHHSRIGHTVKTRAQTNYILYNRITDEYDGNSSYNIDISNGGIAYVIGNLVQQGQISENSGIISYGAEGLKYDANEFYLVNNTVVNDRPQGGAFVFVKPGTNPARIVNNLFIGRGVINAAGAEQSNNVRGDKNELISPLAYDYHLRLKAEALNAGIEPGTANGFSLQPTEQYVHKAGSEPRPVAGKIDVGAYEHE